MTKNNRFFLTVTTFTTAEEINEQKKLSNPKENDSLSNRSKGWMNINHIGPLPGKLQLLEKIQLSKQSTWDSEFIATLDLLCQPSLPHNINVSTISHLSTVGQAALSYL